MIRTSISDSGKTGALGQGLIIEIHIAGVENGPAFRAQEDAGGAEDMAGVAIFKTQLIVRPGRAAFAIDREGLAEPAMLPAIGGPVGLAMREERIDHADLLPLPRHDVDRIMEESVADRGGRLGHENARLRLLPHENRERADVIEMRVRKEKRVDGQPAQSLRGAAAPSRPLPWDACRNRAPPPARRPRDNNNWRRSQSGVSG